MQFLGGVITIIIIIVTIIVTVVFEVRREKGRSTRRSAPEPSAVRSLHADDGPNRNRLPAVTINNNFAADAYRPFVFDARARACQILLF